MARHVRVCGREAEAAGGGPRWAGEAGKAGGRARRPTTARHRMAAPAAAVVPNEQQLLAALEQVQAAIGSSTLLDAAAANELRQQQLNLKLKAKVREQKLQQRVQELEDELAVARKTGLGEKSDNPTAVSGLAKDFVIVHSEIQALRKEVQGMGKELQKLSEVQAQHIGVLSAGQRSHRMDRVAILVAVLVAFAGVLLPMLGGVSR